jgi:hypothetical protein
MTAAMTVSGAPRSPAANDENVPPPAIRWEGRVLDLVALVIGLGSVLAVDWLAIL